MKRMVLMAALVAALAGRAAAGAGRLEADGASGCARVRFEGALHIVCRFDAARDDIALYWAGDDGRPLESFGRLAEMLRKRGRDLLFAMNAGMFSAEHAPIGLYVERGRVIRPLNRRKGPGNFHMLPNGVFWLAGGRAGVTETGRFARARRKVDFATQSGPMLVTDGRIHPRFMRDSASRKIRNGVGVAADGRTVWLAISEQPVNFHAFARLFRDKLKTPNALFLDGTISQIHAPALGQYGGWSRIGPMIAVSAPKGG